MVNEEKYIQVILVEIQNQEVPFHLGLSILSFKEAKVTSLTPVRG